MRKRQAFTLVEMMVSMALVIFIMVLLSQAFIASMQTFRTLKGLGDMEEKLRTAAAIMRRDLSAQHFDTRKSISDSHFFDKGTPNQGYFRVYHGSPTVRPTYVNLFTPANVYEGLDGDGIPSARCTDHSIVFMVKLQGNGRDNIFITNISSDTSPIGLSSNSAYQDAGTYVGQMAEVCYFLKLSEIVPGGPRLYGLYRRQLIAVPNSDTLNATPIPRSHLAQSNAYAEISCKPEVKKDPSTGLDTFTPNIYFNSPTDLTVPQRRFGMNPLNGSPADTLPNMIGGDGGALLPNPQTGYPLLCLPDSGYPVFADLNYMVSNTPPGLYIPPIAYGSLSGADILVNDVISFEIKLLIDFTDTYPSGTTRSDGKSGLRTTPLGRQVYVDPYVDLFDSQVYLKENALPASDAVPYLGCLKSPNPRFDFTNGLNQVLNGDTNGTTAMPRGPAVYDTWSSLADPTYDYSGWRPKLSDNTSKTLPLSCPILAIQITLRIWDKNTQQTRQMTFIQQM